MATSVQKKAWMAELWNRLRRHNETDLEAAYDLLAEIADEQMVTDQPDAILDNHNIAMIAKAAARDMRVVLTPAVENLSKTALNAAEDNDITVDVVCSLTDAEGNVHSWFNGGIFGLTTAEECADEHISAPSLEEGEDSPDLASGTVTVTLSFDADEESTKTYADADYITLTAASLTSGDEAGLVFGAEASYSTYSVATITVRDIPTITNVDPATGDIAGGTKAVLTGTNFYDVTAVTFGGAAAVFEVDSPTQITCTSPAGTAGLTDIVVTAVGGDSEATDNYTYTSG